MADRLVRLVDPLLAVALLVAGQLALWLLPADESGFVAPRPVDALAIVLTCLALAWRGRRPLTVFAVVLGSTWVWLLLFYAEQPQPPFFPAVALLLAAFAAAAVPRGRSAWVVGAAVTAFLVSTDVPAVLGGRSWGDVVPAWVLFALSWSVGRAVGLRQQRAASAETRAAEAEAGRAEAVRLAADAERGRIARELHDVVTHAVTVMVVQAAAEARTLPADSRTGRTLTDIESAGREALAELRRMLGVLRAGDRPDDRRPPASLDQLGELLEDSRRSGLDVRLDVHGAPQHLPAAIDLSAYRIVQEGLTNARRHGDGGEADLVLDWCADSLTVELVNTSGTGTDLTGGVGLVGLQERVALHGGTLDAGPAPGGRFRLCASLPLDRCAS